MARERFVTCKALQLRAMLKTKHKQKGSRIMNLLPHTLGTYEYPTLYETSDTESWLSGAAVVALAALCVGLAILMIAAMWRIYTKANRPGWAALVPVYNTLQLLWTAGKPWWWILLLMIPVVDIVVAVLLYNALAQRFGKKGIGFTLLLLVLPVIGFPMLAWGNAKYKK